MDEDMSFPNPVERHDLPVKKPRWPKVVAALLVLGVLIIIGLPQILHTRIGRRIVRARLESRYGGEVLLEDFRTSWFGGTTARQFWIKAADGHVVGCANFASDKLSLWKLLRNRYELGHCTIDGLVVEYVLDHGDETHSDTYERMMRVPPRAPGMPPTVLAKLSGNVTLTNSQLWLIRAEMQPKILQTASQTVKFTGLAGSFEIPSLDRPWKFNVTGDGGLTASGTLCLGEAGLLTPQDVTADVTAAADYVPTDLAAVLLPQVNVADCRSAFGDAFDRPQVTVTGTGGVLQLHVQANASKGKFDLAPTFDLKTQPATMKIDAAGQNVITAALPKGYAGTQLPVANPLLDNATEGRLTLRIESLSAPFSRNWLNGTAKATLELSDVKLAAPKRTDKVLTQLTALAGATDLPTEIRVAPEPLTFHRGRLEVAPTTIDLGGDAHATLAGKASASDGSVNYTLAVTSPALAAATGSATPVTVPLTGTATQPVLDVDAAIRALPSTAGAKLREYFNDRSKAVREKQIEALLKEKDRQVKELPVNLDPGK
jgi:hypothetical protein